MISKGKQQFHTLLAGYFVTFGKFIGNPICHANVNRICLKGPTFQVLTHPKDLSVLQPQTKAGLYQRSGILKKNGCMTLYDYMIPSLPAKKILKITILSKNEPTGTAHVKHHITVPNFWIFWISHGKKKAAARLGPSRPQKRQNQHGRLELELVVEPTQLKSYYISQMDSNGMISSIFKVRSKKILETTTYGSTFCVKIPWMFHRCWTRRIP